MNVTLITGNFPPDLGGPAAFLEKLCSRMHKAGHKVTVICYGEKYGSPEFPFNVIRISRELPAILRFALFIAKTILRSIDSDLIMACDYSPPGFAASVLLGKPLLLRQVSDPAWEWAYRTGRTDLWPDPFQKDRDLPSLLRHLIHLAGALWADRIIVPSRYMARIVSGWGVVKKRITLIPNAPEMQISKAQDSKECLSRDEARRKLGIKGFTMLYAGRIIQHKRIDLILKVFAEVKKSIAHAELIIAGDGPEKENLMSLSENISDIRWTGELKQYELSSYYRASDVLLLLSEYEGMSHVLLEAQASGLPAVASDRGGNPEVVKHGKTGFIVPFDDVKASKDAIIKLSNTSTWSAFSEQSQKTGTLYNGEKRASRYLEIMEETAEKI